MVHTDCDSDCDSEFSSDMSMNTAMLEVTKPSAIDKERQSSYEEIVFYDDLDGLGKLEDDAIQLAVWRRGKLPRFIPKLADPSIDPASLPAFEGVVTPDICYQVLKTYLSCPYNLRSKKENALDDDSMEELITEIDKLVAVFSKASGSELVNVKLEVMGDDGCRFWHQDSVPMRLVATYRGPCTEWVPPRFSSSTLRKRMHNSNHSRSLTHHDVALFRGRGLSTLDDSALIPRQDGIVHRSPRIDGQGVFRLVLVLDIPVEGWHY